MTIKDLARQTLAMLELQQRYFRTRKPSDLQVSKDAERRLRQACQELLSDEKQGTLFTGEQSDVDETYDRR